MTFVCFLITPRWNTECHIQKCLLTLGCWRWSGKLCSHCSYLSYSDTQDSQFDTLLLEKIIFWKNSLQKVTEFQKIKLHENIHRNFLCTLGEENSEVEGKEYEAPQKREKGKEGKPFLIPNPEVVSYLKSLQMCMLELTLEKKQASHTHLPPHRQAMKKAKKKNSPIKSSSFLPWTNLVNWTSK